MQTVEFYLKYRDQLANIRKKAGNLKEPRNAGVLDGELFFWYLDNFQDFFLNLPFEEITDVDHDFYNRSSPDSLKEAMTREGEFDFYYNKNAKRRSNHISGNMATCIYCKKELNGRYRDFSVDFYIGHLFDLIMCERCYHGEIVVPERALPFYRLLIIVRIIDDVNARNLDARKMYP